MLKLDLLKDLPMYDIDNSRRSSSLHQKLHKSHASCWISLTWLP